ncbi:hypothetical protein QL285_029950 [Trifolium repens]|jgi:hypothetical protein|nr:hypothetical protein QL285_029950 [Trifolium repens]
MKELGSLHKAQRKITVKLGKYMFNNCFGHKNPWTSLVKDALLVAILKKPDSLNIARYDDENADEIIRFVGACYSHANEHEFQSQRKIYLALPLRLILMLVRMGITCPRKPNDPFCLFIIITSNI